KELGLERVCLSGGVFQNDPLTAKIKELLTAEGFKVFTHRKVPPNDGGISLGQVVYNLNHNNLFYEEGYCGGSS
ncbi:Kae1-like domain-containing protein, partial [Hydrogenivirga sp.]